MKGDGGLQSHPKRPRIHLGLDGKVKCDGVDVRVVLSKYMLYVGCTDITPEALNFLTKAYEKAFEKPEVKIQDGIC